MDILSGYLIVKHDLAVVRIRWYEFVDSLFSVEWCQTTYLYCYSVEIGGNQTHISSLKTGGFIQRGSMLRSGIGESLLIALAGLIMF